MPPLVAFLTEDPTFRSVLAATTATKFTMRLHIVEGVVPVLFNYSVGATALNLTMRDLSCHYYDEGKRYYENRQKSTHAEIAEPTRRKMRAMEAAVRETRTKLMDDGACLGLYQPSDEGRWEDVRCATTSSVKLQIRLRDLTSLKLLFAHLYPRRYIFRLCLDISKHLGLGNNALDVWGVSSRVEIFRYT